MNAASGRSPAGQSVSIFDCSYRNAGNGTAVNSLQVIAGSQTDSVSVSEAVSNISGRRVERPRKQSGLSGQSVYSRCRRLLTTSGPCVGMADILHLACQVLFKASSSAYCNK